MNKNLIKCINRILIYGVFFSIVALLVDIPSSAQNKSVRINETGETYGSSLFNSESLDLISAKATNGNVGYIRSEDLEGDLPLSPTEALKLASEERTIPVYESDGETIVGYFIIEAGEEATPLLTRGNATSNLREFTVDGWSYYNQAAVYVYNTSNPYVESRAKVSAYRTVDAGWLGTSPQLYDEDGNLVATSSYRYNSSACVSIETITTYNTSTGTYYACGKTRVWNSTTNSYYSTTTYASPNQNF